MGFLSFSEDRVLQLLNIDDILVMFPQSISGTLLSDAHLLNMAEQLVPSSTLMYGTSCKSIQLSNILDALEIVVPRKNEPSPFNDWSERQPLNI